MQENLLLYAQQLAGDALLKMLKHFEVRRDQVNLLVYGPDRPYFKQKQKNNISKFWLSGLFLIHYFLLLKKNKKRNTT